MLWIQIPKRLNLDPDPQFWPNLDPDSGPDPDPGLLGYATNFERKIKNIFREKHLLYF